MLITALPFIQPLRCSDEEVEPNEALTITALLGAEAARKKRDRDVQLAPLAFGGIGEDGEPERRVELFVGENPDAEVWEHKTLYCLREKQDEEANKGRFWVQWRSFKNDNDGAAGVSGRVVVLVRTRDWQPKERKYRLKAVKGNEDKNGWRLFAVHDAERKKGKMEEEAVIDAKNVRVEFVGQTMTLQEALTMIGAAVKALP